MRLLPDRPQYRFLLRALGLLIGMFLLWWILLLDPLLVWVRHSGDFVLGWAPGAAEGPHVIVNPDGSWMLRLPVPAAAAERADLQRIAGGGAPNAQPKKVRSFKLGISRNRVAMFTVALPLYWALMLAVPGKKLLRMLAYGSAGIAAAMPFTLTLDGMITIRTYFHIQSTPLFGFLWNAVGYLNSEVLPYATPLFLGLWLNRELRTQVFAWVPAAEPAPEAPATRRERKRQRRRDARAT
jgi:hypothetical protein